MSPKTIIKELGHIGHDAIIDLQSIWNKSYALYEKLDEEYQDALKQGSWILGVINANLNSPTAIIITGILSQFGINTQAAIQALSAVTRFFNLQVDDHGSLQELVQEVAVYLSSLKGGVWRTLSEGIAVVQAIALNKSLPDTVGGSVITTVYQDIIRPLLVKMYPASFATT